MKTVSHHSRIEGEALFSRLAASTGVITIRNAADAPYDLSQLPDALELVFEDYAAGAPANVIAMYEGQPDLFSLKQAHQILDWLDSRARGHCLVICRAGQSRSAAVARFIADRYCLPFDSVRGKHYNEFVRWRLHEAFASRHPCRAFAGRMRRALFGAAPGLTT